MRQSGSPARSPPEELYPLADSAERLPNNALTDKNSQRFPFHSGRKTKDIETSLPSNF
jgi:hypothetical protein